MLETSNFHKTLYNALNLESTSIVFPDPRLEHLKHCINNVTVDGLYLEFGVFRGYTINYIAELVPNCTVYGFDSFQGLPEPWLWLPQGEFSTAGELPKVRDNVSLVQGWFHETLPNFNLGPVALAHIDCDLYASTKCVLDALEPYIVPGTIIAFDDFPYFPGSEEHEYRAFTEFITRTKRSYQVLSKVTATPYTSVIFT